MYLASLGKLALGSRLKALSDHFYGVADEVYRALGAPIESRWLPVLRYLWDSGPSTVTDVANAIGQTHSAVSQLTDKLVRAGARYSCLPTRRMARSPRSARSGVPCGAA